MTTPVPIALAGNPNGGKTTLFNLLTGAKGHVGNWPGVTVERKQGFLRGHEDILIQDLPGVYSLSSYSPEETVAADYLLSGAPKAILNVVNVLHLERSLYLTTQLLETEIPVVVALNMMDALHKTGADIDHQRLSRRLGCPVVKISALYGEGGREAALAAADASRQTLRPVQNHIFSGETEHSLSQIAALLQDISEPHRQRFYAVKCLERNDRLTARLSLDPGRRRDIENIAAAHEARMEEDNESTIAAGRYVYAAALTAECLQDKPSNAPEPSARIDRILTGRFTALPVFALVMFLLYFFSVTTLGAFLGDYVRDTLFGAWLVPALRTWLAAASAPLWLTGLLLEGALGGLGAVLGFIPQMFILFALLALLEDVGYMARVAFIMDRLLRPLGLSGKSFIPLLVGSGCTVPAVMAARTVENLLERRMTVMTAALIPCGAKLPVVGLITGALFGGEWWAAPSAYFLGLASVAVSGMILGKTRPFAGESSAFVMELPPYHYPLASNILRHAADRSVIFLRRAAVVITAAGVALWLLSNLSLTNHGLGLTDGMEHSLLASLGKSIAPLFEPLGFGHWEAAVATVMGLFAKEQIVVALGVLLPGGAADISAAAGNYFTPLDGFAFMLFNLFCVPCVAAMNAIRQELGSPAWTAAAYGYLCAFAYSVALIWRQLGLWFTGGSFTPWIAAAWLLLALGVYLLLRPRPAAPPSVDTKQPSMGCSVCATCPSCPNDRKP